MKTRRLIAFFAFVAVCVLLFSQCQKEADRIGYGLLSPEDLLGLGYTDTVDVWAYTLPVDSVTTSGQTYALIGSMFDPVFGRTDATCYTQVLGDPLHSGWGDMPVVDSCILSLPYMGGLVGDSMTPMTLKVYQLTEDIQNAVDRIYSSQSTVAYDESHLLGQVTFLPRPKDSVVVNNKTTFPQVRIPLSKYFSDQILALPDSVITSQVNFQKNYKGFCILAEPQTTPGKGAIVYFALPSDNSKYSQVFIHYHNVSDTIKQTTLTLGGNRFYNYNHHNYNDATQDLRDQLAGNTALGNQTLYLQGTAGTRVKLQIPNLQKWTNKQLMINDAQLIITNVDTTTSLYTTPPHLSLYLADSTTNTPTSNLLPDYAISSSFIDGYYNSSNKTYRFHIPRYMQQVLIGKKDNYGIFITVSNEGLLASRVVLNGKDATSRKMKLLVKYSYKQ